MSKKKTRNTKRKTKPNNVANRTPNPKRVEHNPRKVNTKLLVGIIAAIVVVAAVAFPLWIVFNRPHNPVVATVNGLDIDFITMSDEMLQAEGRILSEMGGVSFDVHLDGVTHGETTVGDAVRQNAVRNAATRVLIEEYGRQVGASVTSANRREADEVIDEVEEHMLMQEGPAGFENWMWVNYFGDVDQVRRFVHNSMLRENIAHAIINNPTEFARFEPHMEEDATIFATRIMERAHAGEDFDALVAAYGQDPGMVGNLQGYTFSPGQMVPEFENATRELEIGEISGLVPSQFGYHIIMRVEPDPDQEVEGVEMLGAKHILINFSDSIEERLAAAIQVYFGLMADAAAVELLPAFDEIGFRQ